MVTVYMKFTVNMCIWISLLIFDCVLIKRCYAGAADFCARQDHRYVIYRLKYCKRR